MVAGKAYVMQIDVGLIDRRRGGRHVIRRDPSPSSRTMRQACIVLDALYSFGSYMMDYILM